MNRSMWGTPRVAKKLMVALVGALIAGGVGTVSLSSLSSAQAVEGGNAICDALDVDLFAANPLGTVFLDISGGTDDVVAPDENGTNTGGDAGEVTVSGIGAVLVTIDLVTCEATRAPDSLSAESVIAGGGVTGSVPELVTLNSVMSDVSCPAAGTGDPTASASASLTIDGEAVELDTDGGMLADEVNVEFSISGIIDGIINVAAETSATADDDSAAATGLEITATFSGAFFEESVVLDFGTVTFAETSCTLDEPGDGPPPTTPPPTTPSPTTPSPTTLPPIVMLPETR